MPSSFIARRINEMSESATVEITRQANSMREKGIDVISLSAGLPDFDTPHNIREAGIAAINAGHTRYTSVDGTERLRTAICRDIARRKSIAYEADEVLVSSGAKQSLFNAILATINPGDEVLIPAPFWVSYPEMIKLAGATPRILETAADGHYKITADQLTQALGENTRALIINSPSNPTGQRYEANELKALAAVLKKHPQLILISDEIYDQVHWSADTTLNLLEVEPTLRNRYLLINGVSKSHAMTGWRIGYCAGPTEIIAAMRRIQGQSTSNACSISQAAAVEALEGPQGYIVDMNRAYADRYRLATGLLEAMPGMHHAAVECTFYLFLDIGDAIRNGGYRSDVDFAARLLEQQAVATVPGTAFGCPDHLRLSIASSEQEITEACARIGKFLQAASA